MQNSGKRHFYSGIAALLLILSAGAGVSTAAAQTTRSEGIGHGTAYSEYMMGVFLLESESPARALPHLEAAWLLAENDPAIGYALSDAYYRVGDLEAAETIVKTLLEQDPEDATAMLWLAKIDHARGNIEAALEQLQRLREMGDPNFDAERLIGRIEFDRGEYEAALEAYDNAIRIDGGYPFIHHRRALLLMALGRNEESEAAFRRAIALLPDYSEAVLDLAELLVLEGRVDEALAALQELLGHEGDFAEALLMSANLLAEMEKPEEAIDVLEQRANALPREGVILLGRLYYDVGRYDDALGIFRSLYDIEPHTPELARILGEVSLKKGNAGDALDYYRQAIALAPDDFRNYLALFFVSSKEFREPDETVVELPPDEARQLLDRAASLLTDGDFEGYYVVGIAYQSLDDYQRSQELLERALQLKPDDEGALLNLAGVLEKRGQYDLAREHVERLYRLQPDDPVVCNFYGYILTLMNRDLDKAELLIRTALQHEPDNGYYVDSLGWMYYVRGEYDHAVKELERASGLVHEDPVILEHLGDAYWALEDYHRALTAYEKARVAGNGSQGVLDKLEAARARLED